MRRTDRQRIESATNGARIVAAVLALLLGAACGRSLYAPPACSDGVDNDGDGRTDLDDPQCSDPGDDDEGPGGAADADAEAGDGGADGDGGPDVDDDTGMPDDAGPDGETDDGADGDDGDAEEVDGDAHEPCEDGRSCDAMPLGRCVSGACAAVWESTADGDRFGQAVALEGSRAAVAPPLSPGLALVGAPEGTACWGHAAALAAADWTEAAAWDGGAALERFGWAVAIGPDLGGPVGVALAVGTMAAASPTAHGRVAIYGSATDLRAPVRELPGPLEGSAFGAAVAWGPDVNGDDVEDLVVGAPSFRPGSDTVGAAFLYAGGTWTQIRSWSGTAGSRFGTAVARGPAGGRGRPAMTLVGAPGEDLPAADAGCAYLYEGTADTPTWSACGDGLQAGFGKALAAGSDVDGDGNGDFAVGSPGWDDRTGKVDLLALGAPYRSWIGAAEEDDFGSAVALGPDADGRPGGELLVGAPGVGGNRGRVYLFRFDEEAPLRVWDGEATGDRFGCAVALGGDVDGDGRADALVGACGADARPGKVYLFGSASW